MSDFWDDAASTDVPEPPKPTFDNMPDGVALIVRTTSGEDKETVRPTFKDVGKEKPFWKFKAPVIVIGGEAKLDPKFVGRYLFLDLNIEKPTVEQLSKGIATARANGNDNAVKRLEGQLGALSQYPCAPELYNLILDTLAPTGASTKERWQVAVGILKAVATTHGITPDTHGGVQIVYAAAFKEVLMACSYTVIGKTYTPKQREGSTYVPNQTLGSIGSDTEDERKKRKVRLIEVAPKEDF